MEKGKKIFVAGGRGLVGSAIIKNLKERGYSNIISPSHSELDLINQSAVESFFAKEKPSYVFLAAAKVGGIMANNTYRADFIYQNIMISANVIHSSYKHNVEKLLFLGSTCIYPREAHQPMCESELLTSPLEYTNEPYAMAKITGIKMCESYNIQYGTNFLSVMPTNLYGPSDNFDLETGHVLPSIIRKIYLAKMLEDKNFGAIERDFEKRPTKSGTEDLRHFGIESVKGRVVLTLWGSGKPLREFLWSEDMADASVFVMENIEWGALSKGLIEKRNTHINIGTGEEIAISEVAKIVAEVVGFSGEIKFDSTKPDGTMRKLTDPTKLNDMGWRHRVGLRVGIERLYEWYIG